jgi:uracil-DNA glycosylase family 4
MTPWSTKWKSDKLQQLHQEWYKCTKCQLCKKRHKVVFGEGNPNADLMFIGEAPGETEDKEGLPFVGKSGQILRAMWTAASQKWESIYITNLVCCRPPGNRNPTSLEKNACFARLQEQIYLVDPLLVVAVGREALQFLAGGRALSIEEKHGRLLSPGVSIGGCVFPRTGDDRKTWNLTYDMVPIYHPAFILRKDSYNSETDSFETGGVAQQTYEDLERILTRVKLIKEAFEKVNPSIARTRECLK